MLKIVEYLKVHGLDKTVSDFKLIVREYPHKVLLKYNQIESNMGLEEVIECRGLVLEKNTWGVLSYPFKKFFNFGESFANNINLKTAKCLIKEDGTFIHLYYDWVINKWCSGTTGMAEGEGSVDYSGITFSELFWGVAKFEVNKLDKNLIYFFELCTDRNIVVTPHSESKVVLLGVRNRVTLNELNYNELIDVSNYLNINLVNYIDIDIKHLDEIKSRFVNMPFHEEGYVIVDDNFNRVKMKNPAYVAAHFLKSKTSSHHIMEIIKQNEIDEFIATFPNKRGEIVSLKEDYNNLKLKLNLYWSDISKFTPNNSINQKDFANKLFKFVEENNIKHFIGLFFGLANKKIKSIDDYLIILDNKKLYEILR